MLVPLDVKVNCQVRRSKHIVELLPTPAAVVDTEKDLGEDEAHRYTGGRLFSGDDDNGGGEEGKEGIDEL